ncbi:Uncharacterised protein [Pragia fontium]|uniref:hypothetical protein n=1 Tax=Pragia fontium TaxID=82985 RepID=UPI000E05273F|nr:hypothetical protein [Pragia fontium]SUB81989.1 Uncharacterised protein [Pragia fontium]
MTDIRERFLNDVENHSIQVLHDDGVYRHLRFDENGSNYYHFNLTTWPGYLCISGDMGCFTFSRLEDMFRFFRRNELIINAGYWAEKVQAGAGHGRDKICKEWSQELFEKNVKEHVRYAIEGLPFSERRRIWQEVKDDILTAEDEWSSVQAIRDFDSNTLDFCDFWESDSTEYTTHYLWCCYAIVWGIQRYDEATALLDGVQQ